LDVLLVINQLNLQSASQAEGESRVAGSSDPRFPPFDGWTPGRARWLETDQQLPIASPPLGRIPPLQPSDWLRSPALPAAAGSIRAVDAERETRLFAGTPELESWLQDAERSETELALAIIAADVHDAIGGPGQ
jgi:hypothetical protein